MPPNKGGFATSSKLLQKKWEERKHKAHVTKMRSIKAGVDNSPPKPYPHLSMRLKKVQKDEQRQAEIEHENQLLLQKMTHIMKSRGRVDNWNDYQSPSGSYAFRERQQEKIAEENVGIAKRLETVRPMYHVHDWEDEYQRHEYFLDMKARETKDYELTPRGRRHGAGYDDYESDFEDDESTNASSNRLPRIRSRDSSSEAKGKGQKKDPTVTKLPQIKSTRDAIADQDAKLLFKGSKQLVKPQDAVLKALIKRSHAQRVANRDKFGELYDSDLGSEMKSTLGKDYHVLIDALLTDRDSADVELFNQAIHNNNSAAVVEFFCSRSSAAISNANKAYKKEYDVTIEEDIEYRILDKDSQTLLQALLAKGRSTSTSVNKEKANSDAQAIHQAGAGKFSDEDDKFMALLRTCSTAQIKATFQSYKKVSGGKSLVDSVQEDGCSKDFTKAVKAMDKCLNSGANMNADKVHSLLKGGKEKDLIEFLLARSENDLPEIRSAYRKKYGDDLANDILSRLKKDTASLIAQIASKQPPGQKASKEKDASPKRVNGMVIRPPPKRSPVRRPQGKTGADDTSEASSSERKGPQQKQKGDNDSQTGKGTQRGKGSQENKGQKGGQASKDKDGAGKGEGRGGKGEGGAGKGAGGGDRKGGGGGDGKRDGGGGAREDRSGGDAKEGGGAKGGGEKGGGGKGGGTGAEGKNQDKSGGGTKGAGKGKDKKSPAGSKSTLNSASGDEITQLHDAMKDFGTDEEPLIKILSSKTNDQRQQLKQKYNKKYKKDLVEELKSELSGDFEELILALMMTPTEYDAYCLHEAMEGLGTSEAALIGILTTRKAKDLKAISTKYKETYGADLTKDLKGDTSGGFEEMLLQLTKAERAQGDAVDKKMADEDARRICTDGEEKKLDPNSEHFVTVMTKRNRAQLRATFEEYKKLTGHDIEEGIQKSMSGDTEDGYIGLVKAISDPVEFYAVRLHDAMSGMGTNDSQLIRIIVSRAESDLAAIKACYKKLYKKTLEESIDSDTSGDYKRLLLALVRGDKKQKTLTTVRRKPNQLEPLKGPKGKVLSPSLMNGPNVLPKTPAIPRNVKANSTARTAVASDPTALKPKRDVLILKPLVIEAQKDNSSGAEAAGKESHDLAKKAPRIQPTNKRNHEIGNKRKEIKPVASSSKVTNDKINRTKPSSVSGKKKQEDKRGVLPPATFPVTYVEAVHRSMHQGKACDLLSPVKLLLLKTNKERQTLKPEYHNKYNEVLTDVMKKKFSGSCHELIDGLLSTPGEYDAHCLHDAMDRVTSGDPVLTTILVSRSAKELEVVGCKYKEMYGKELVEDITAHAKNDEVAELLIELIKTPGDGKCTINVAKANEDAAWLYKGGYVSLSPANSTLRRIFTAKNPRQANEVFCQYQQMTGHNLEDGIRKAGNEKNEATLIALVSCLRDPIIYYADTILKALSPAATDDKTLIKLIVARAETDLLDIKDTFQQLYGTLLYDRIDSDCNGNYKKALLAVVEKTWPQMVGQRQRQSSLAGGHLLTDGNEGSVWMRSQNHLLDMTAQDEAEQEQCSQGKLVDLPEEPNGADAINEEENAPHYKKVRSFSVSGEDDCILGETKVPKKVSTTGGVLEGTVPEDNTAGENGTQGTVKADEDMSNKTQHTVEVDEDIMNKRQEAVMVGVTSKTDDTAMTDKDTGEKTPDTTKTDEGASNETKHTVKDDADISNKTQDSVDADEGILNRAPGTVKPTGHSSDENQDTPNVDETTQDKMEENQDSLKEIPDKANDQISDKTHDTGNHDEDCSNKAHGIINDNGETQNETQDTVKADEDTPNKTQDTVKADEDTQNETQDTFKADEDTQNETQDTVKADEDTKNEIQDTVEAGEDTQNKTQDTAKADEDTQNETDDTVKADEDTQNETQDTVKADEDTQNEIQDTVKADGDTQNETQDTVKANEDTQNETQDTVKADEDTQNERQDTVKADEDTQSETQDTVKADEDTQNETQDTVKTDEDTQHETQDTVRADDDTQSTTPNTDMADKDPSNKTHDTVEASGDTRNKTQAMVRADEDTRSTLQNTEKGNKDKDTKHETHDTAKADEDSENETRDTFNDNKDTQSKPEDTTNAVEDTSNATQDTVKEAKDTQNKTHGKVKADKATKNETHDTAKADDDTKNETHDRVEADEDTQTKLQSPMESDKDTSSETRDTIKADKVTQNETKDIIKADDDSPNETQGTAKVEGDTPNESQYTVEEAKDTENKTHDTIKTIEDTHNETHDTIKADEDTQSKTHETAKADTVTSKETQDTVEVNGEPQCKTQGDEDTQNETHDTVKADEDTQKETHDAVKADEDTQKETHDTVKADEDTQKETHDTVKADEDTQKETHDTVKADEDTLKQTQHTGRDDSDTSNETNDTVETHEDTQNDTNDTVETHEDTQNETNDTVETHEDTQNETNDTVESHEDTQNETNDTVETHEDTQNETNATVETHEHTQNGTNDTAKVDEDTPDKMHDSANADGDTSNETQSQTRDTSMVGGSTSEETQGTDDTTRKTQDTVKNDKDILKEAQRHNTTKTDEDGSNRAQDTVKADDDVFTNADPIKVETACQTDRSAIAELRGLSRQGRESGLHHDDNVNGSTDVDKNENTDVDKNESTDVDKNESNDVDQNESTGVDKKESTSFDKNEIRPTDIDKNKSTDVDKNECTDGYKTERPYVDKNETVDDNKIGTALDTSKDNDSDKNTIINNYMQQKNVEHNEEKDGGTTSKMEVDETANVNQNNISKIEASKGIDIASPKDIQDNQNRNIVASQDVKEKSDTTLATMNGYIHDGTRGVDSPDQEETMVQVKEGDNTTIGESVSNPDNGLNNSQNNSLTTGDGSNLDIPSDNISNSVSLDSRDYVSSTRDDRLAETASSMDDNISYEDTDVGKYDELDLSHDMEIVMKDSTHAQILRDRAADHAVLPPAVGETSA